MIGESVGDSGLVHEHVDSVGIYLDALAVSIKKFEIITTILYFGLSINLSNLSTLPISSEIN